MRSRRIRFLAVRVVDSDRNYGSFDSLRSLRTTEIDGSEVLLWLEPAIKQN